VSFTFSPYFGAVLFIAQVFGPAAANVAAADGAQGSLTVSGGRGSWEPQVIDQQTAPYNIHNIDIIQNAVLNGTGVLEGIHKSLNATGGRCDDGAPIVAITFDNSENFRTREGQPLAAWIKITRQGGDALQYTLGYSVEGYVNIVEADTDGNATALTIRTQGMNPPPVAPACTGGMQ